MNDFLVIYSILSGFFLLLLQVLCKKEGPNKVVVMLRTFEFDLGHALMAFPFSQPYFPVCA